jgi:hypothetical protein
MPKKKKEVKVKVKVAKLKGPLETFGPVEEFEYSGINYLRVRIPKGWLVMRDSFVFLEMEHDIFLVTDKNVDKYQLHDYFEVVEV